MKHTYKIDPVVLQLINCLIFLAHKHNTYHGPSNHLRASLSQNLDAKPLRFTDSPQHRLSRSRRKTRPPPRRKSSSACTNDRNDVSFKLKFLLE